ncbi:MAG: hypothetical protein E7351_01020 [Clostridiales bacterium]|nr:hypothetical protein [Clostridiales bacterium]
MEYNDFPILNNEEYRIINEQYSISQTQDRKSLLYKITHLLRDCKNMCSTLDRKLNQKIVTAISTAKKEIDKISDNLSSYFPQKTENQSTITSFNLFTFLSKVNSLSSLFHIWENSDSKDYYKTMASKSLKDLLKISQNILSALENSTVYLFKYL